MGKVSLNHLKLWQKITVLLLAMSLPAVLVGVFYWRSATGRLTQARAELGGVQYLGAIAAFQSAVVTHESRVFLLGSGDAAAKPAALEAAQQADDALQRLAGINAKFGESYGVRRDFKAVAAEWNSLAGASLTQPAAQGVEAHGALMARLGRLGEAVASGSLVKSDPNQDTRSLIEITARYLPAALSDEAALRRNAEDAAVKGYLGGDDHMGIEIAHGRLLSDFAAIHAALRQVSPAVRAPLEQSLQAASAQADVLYGTISSQIVNASTLKISAAELHQAGSGARSALTDLLTASSAATKTAMRGRIAAIGRQRDLNLVLVLVAIALIHALTWALEHSLTAPLKRVVAVFERIATGRYDSEVNTDRTDEIGRVLQALAAMQTKLHTQIEDERAVAAENSRIRQALDKTSTGVLLADAGHRIIYVNEAAQTGFTSHAADFRRSLSGFDPAALRGSSLEALSNSPAEERRALDTLRDTRTEERTFGALNFRVITNPVTGAQGERLGTVMEWAERSQEMRVEQELQGVLSAVNGDDLTLRISADNKSGFFAALGEGVNRLADNLAEVVAKVKHSAREIFVGAEEITMGNSNLSTRTEEQASSLEETASSMEEMTTTVKQNADNAAQANQLAVAARDQAEQGVSVVGKAVRAMSGIDESAQKIADIIGVIDEIAFQTNLLALNAAVEAARAGEQGRGFAVVASEVRSLAGRSATAAKEIKSLIEDSVRKVADGSRLVTDSGHTLGEIVASVKKVSDIVAEIAAASREQAAGIEQVNRAVMQMDQITQQNAALVEETIASSQVMTGQVRDLNEELGRFKLTDAAQNEPQASGATPASRPARAAGEGR